MGLPAPGDQTCTHLPEYTGCPPGLTLGAPMHLRPALLFLALDLARAGAPVSPPAPAPIPAEDVRRDFQELYEGLRASHYDLYARRPKAQYDACFARTLQGFDHPLPLGEVQAAFQRFTAFGRVAHANLGQAAEAFEAFRKAGGRAIPLRIRVLRKRTYVTDSFCEDPRIRPGVELVALDGRPMPQVLQSLGQFISADSDYMLHTFLEHDFPRTLWHLWGEREAYRATFRAPDGRVFRARVEALTRAEVKARSQQQPPTFELDWDQREARMLTPTVAYLRPGPFYNVAEGATDPWDATAFLRFLDDAFTGFIRSGAARLVIDLRDNPGGDSSFSDPMLAWFATRPFRFASAFRIKASVAAEASNAKRLPQSAEGSVSHRMAEAYKAHRPGERFAFDLPFAQPREGRRFQGKVFLLINRHSYSNTVTVAALAQDYGFARILGEETSDLATTYGASEQFQLPRTGLTVNFPKAHIIRPSGDLRARGVVPDVAIPTPLVETEDSVLRRALQVALE